MVQDITMNRRAFGNKSLQLNTQRPRLDRFVPTRDSMPDLRRRFTWTHRCDDSDDDIWSAKYLKRKKYANYLAETFEPVSLIMQEPKTTEHEKHDFYVHPWPCVPRKKNFLTSADSILDLPTYSYAAFPELLDWSSDNILVAALGRNYHKWSWHTQSLISQGITQYEIQCCKFDPKGEHLALGTDMKMIEIHNNSLSKRIGGTSCCCVTIDTPCSITAIDWSPTGNSFITGCSRGMLISYSREYKMISWRLVPQAVLAVRVSPNARYVAAAAVNGVVVLVMTWPGLHLVSSLDSDWTIKTITWHPWRTALLGVGAVTGSHHAHVAVWDVPTARVQETTLSKNPYSLDAMLFSHKTGELVVSLWNTEGPSSSQKTCSQLVVMSGPNTVTDQWGEGQTGVDRVRTMVFSPDGTKLATATAEEDLIIWNFLPEDNAKKKKTMCKRFSSLPAYLDMVTHGISLR